MVSVLKPPGVGPQVRSSPGLPNGFPPILGFPTISTTAKWEAASIPGRAVALRREAHGGDPQGLFVRLCLALVDFLDFFF